MIQILKCGLFVGIIAVSSVLSGVNSDCMSPPSYENTKYEILVPKTSPVESTAVYFCKSGFSMLGDADYIVLVCRQDEEWIGPEINCTNKVGCGSPPFPAYGSFLAPSENLVYGTNISMTCDEGYVLEGANKLTCSESGAWTTNGETTEVPVCIKECSEEEYLYQFHECYEKREGSVVWEGARSNCETTGGQLATIKDAYRQTFIQNLLRSQPGAYWIGGLEVRGWKYPSDGQYANYFNWAPGEPNYGHEHCVYLSNLHGVENAHKWNDETCSRSIIEVDPPMMIYAICEAGGKCENISTTFNHLQYQEKCIIFLDDSPRDQSSATTKCKDDFNGTLVEIRNEKLQKIIENFIDTNMSVIANWWIGLVEELNERTWEWVDGERITQFFWGVGEPNGLDEHCLDLLEVLNYAWNDNNCQYLANYICQYGESKCGNPGSPSHGNMTVHKDSYFIGESVAFSCDSGYVLNDSSLESMTCENDTTWSGNIPVCEHTIGITTLGSGISTITISTAPKRTSFTASTTRRTTMVVTAGQTSNTGTENKITGTVTEPTKSNTGLIIGISLSLVGIIVIVIVVIIVVLLLDRRRKSMSFDVEEKHEEKHEGTPGMYHNPAYVTLGPENNSKEKDDKRLIGY